MDVSKQTIMVKPLLRAAVSTALIMTTFEVTKQTIHPTITIWTSHIITITFTTLLSVVVTSVALKRYGRLRNKMEGEIRRLNSDLKVMNDELEAFNYSVAHDLRNPLNNIASCCQAIEMMCGDHLQGECKDFLVQASQETLRMNKLIGTLLEFSRLAHIEPHRETVDATAMAREVIEELKCAESERSVEVCIGNGITVYADPNLLRIALTNVLGNAWKYTRLRDSALVEFGMEELDGEKVYFVRDNSIGFDMAEAERLFAPFQRLSDAAGYHGCGIGLGTVDRIIRRHGGRIWAEGEKGKGATFYFTFSHQDLTCGGYRLP
jgi:light-regulated signal transduction histidine kinase (bacteriophytochrome)